MWFYLRHVVQPALHVSRRCGWSPVWDLCTRLRITHEPSCTVHHVYSHAHVDLSTPRLKFSLQDVPSKQGDPRRCSSLKIVPVSLALSFSLSLGTRLGESSFSLSSQLLSPFHLFRVLIEHVVVSLTPHLHHSRWIVRYFVCSTFLHDGIRRHFTFASAVSYGAFCTNVSDGFHNLCFLSHLCSDSGVHFTGFLKSRSDIKIF